MPRIAILEQTIGYVLRYGWSAETPGVGETSVSLNPSAVPASGVLLRHQTVVSGAFQLLSGPDQALADADVAAAQSQSKGPVYGLIISLGALSPNDSVDVGAGTARDDTDVSDIKLIASKTVDLTTTGAGGLDTGSLVVDTFYSIWVIKDSSTGAVDVLASTQELDPLLPGTYDLKRRVGWVLTESTPILVPFFYFGDGSTRECLYDWNYNDLFVLGFGNAQTFTKVDCSKLLPPGQRLLWLQSNAFGSTRLEIKRGDGPQAQDEGPWLFRTHSGTTTSAQWLVFTNAAREIEYRVLASGGTVGLGLYVNGFRDQL